MLGTEASAEVQNFVCPIYVRGEEEKEERVDGGDDAGDASLVVDGGELEEVPQFSYLGDVLDCEAGVERAVRARVAAAWGRWRKISNLLVNRNIGLRSRGRVYEACVRSALLYGAETWALTNRLMEVQRSCDRRMLRYMVGVRWQDGRSSSEVAEMCGVEDLSAKLRQRRLRWFGHAERAGGGALNEVWDGDRREDLRGSGVDV